MMNKRLLSIVLALVLILGTVSITNAATGNPKIDWLVEKEYVKGDAGTGNLRLNDTITRAEATSIIIRAQGLEDLALGFKSTDSKFKDLKTTHWANGYINVAISTGIVSGYPDGTFKPEAKIKYSEIITMLVIANGDLPEKNPLVSWEVPYITKATNVGILKDVKIPSYTDNAIRERIFEMIYNYLAKTQETGIEAYKGIVISNERVMGLDERDIEIEVIERISTNSKHRYDKGSNVRVTLPKDMGNTEELLGKVVDITINERNLVSKVEVDNSYSYIVGSSVAKDGELTISGKTYFVLDTDRYTNTMEKVSAVYHNGDEYNSFKSYLDKQGKVPSAGKEKEFSNDFSRVTMKNNRIFFIDSYTFDDIAPVKEIKKSGEEVYIYKDEDNANVVKFTPESVIGFTKDGIQSMDVKDIKANDVVHIYNKNNAIVRRDAMVSGTFDRYREGTDNSYIQFNGTNYLVKDLNKLRPVYSLDGSRFFTLVANKGALDLDPLRNEKVEILLDISDSLQAIVGKLKYDEGVFVIDEIDRRSVAVVNPSNVKSTAAVEFDSVLNFLGSNDKKTIDNFNRGDLVYLFKDGNSIDKIIKLATAVNIDQDAKLVAKTPRGDFEMNRSWMKVQESNNKFSTVLINNANIFIVELDNNKVPRIEGTTIENILDKTKVGSGLRAYVITNKEFNNMALGNNIKSGNEEDVAHTIIFTDYVGSTSSLTREVIRVSYKFNPKIDTTIDGKDVNGKTISRNIDKYANIPTLEPGDIVELGIDKDKVVFEVKVKISVDDTAYKVKEIERYSSTRARWIKLENPVGVVKEYYVDRDALYFDEIEMGDIISISQNLVGDIDALIIHR